MSLRSPAAPVPVDERMHLAHEERSLEGVGQRTMELESARQRPEHELRHDEERVAGSVLRCLEGAGRLVGPALHHPCMAAAKALDEVLERRRSPRHLHEPERRSQLPSIVARPLTQLSPRLLSSPSRRSSSSAREGDDRVREYERCDLPELAPNEAIGSLRHVRRRDGGRKLADPPLLQVAAHPRREVRRREEDLGEG
jgi:hypothetical protein